MCGGASSDAATIQAQQNQQQVAAQQQMAAASLAQAKQIADAQASQNQQAFDYQKQQDELAKVNAAFTANRQAEWDAGRLTNTVAATKQIDDAFSKFTPDYFKQYQQDYTGQATDEIERQYGLAQKDLSFGLARTGNLASTAAADQEGKLIETKGRAEVDQSNAASTAAAQLQQQVAQSKNSLLQQALSSDTLGQPIAPDNEQSVQAGIDTANRAISTVSDNARNYTSTVSPVTPSLGTLSGLFAGALTGVGNTLQGAQDNRLAAAYGGGGAGATGFGSSSTRVY